MGLTVRDLRSNRPGSGGGHGELEAHGGSRVEQHRCVSGDDRSGDRGGVDGGGRKNDCVEARAEPYRVESCVPGALASRPSS